MAQRRMFSLAIVDTDKFLDMPQSTQNLYFHLGMRADDDGFVASPQKIIKIVGSSSDDIKLLTVKGYVIPFDSGVCVITDWHSNNYIQKDRYRPTRYLEEKSQLALEQNGMYTKCIHDVSRLDTQDRLGKGRLELYPPISPHGVTEGESQIADFESFWEAYPRKQSKKSTEKEWEKINPSQELFSSMLVAIEAWKKSEQWQRENGRYIPAPDKWLKNKRWLDELPKAKVSSSASFDDEMIQMAFTHDMNMQVKQEMR